MLFVRRTRHTLRSAEFGFFGVVVYTRRHTPRFCGQERSAGDAVRVLMTSLPRRISCCTVGIEKKALLRPGEWGGRFWGNGRVAAPLAMSSGVSARRFRGARRAGLIHPFWCPHHSMIME